MSLGYLSIYLRGSYLVVVMMVVMMLMMGDGGRACSVVADYRRRVLVENH